MTHVLGKPATPAALSKLHKLAGDAGASIRDFIALHDGMLLYKDTRSEAAGLEIIPVAKWKSATSEMSESFDNMGWNLARSTTQLTMNFEEKPIAKSFSTMFGSLLKDPAKFFLDRGCYTRYRDGKTEKQWIPKEYSSEGERARSGH